MLRFNFIFALFLFCSNCASAESSWKLDYGIRYGVSRGHYKLNLHDADMVHVSRLTFKDLTAHTTEGYLNFASECGFFLKGFLGAGSITGGALLDHDLPPTVVPFSKTYSEQKFGLLGYLTTDLGYRLFSWKHCLTVGGYIGYCYWMENYHAFGAKQIGDNPHILPFPISSKINVLDNHARLNCLRLGTSFKLKLSRNLSLELDAAYLRAAMNTQDFHNLRPDIRGILDDGKGNGFQIDALLHYNLCPGFTLGVGGRVWHVFTKGFAHFEEIFATVSAQPINTALTRYGLLFETRYAFGYNTDPCLLPFCWQGAYFGLNLGYGMNFEIISLEPTSEVTHIFQQILPNKLHLRDAGFLGGAELGYNWQKGCLLVGFETDFNYSNISGSKAVSSSNVDVATTTEMRLHFVSTFRARFGKLMTNKALAYITGGLSFGKIEFNLDQRPIFVTCSEILCAHGTQKKNKAGWCAGAGFEYAISPRFSLKTEYLYFDLGKLSHQALGESVIGTASYQVHSQMSNHSIRLGLNCKLRA